jgi:hypothetical protein
LARNALRGRSARRTLWAEDCLALAVLRCLLEQRGHQLLRFSI